MLFTGFSVYIYGYKGSCGFFSRGLDCSIRALSSLGLLVSHSSWGLGSLEFALTDQTLDFCRFLIKLSTLICML